MAALTPRQKLAAMLGAIGFEVDPRQIAVNRHDVAFKPRWSATAVRRDPQNGGPCDVYCYSTVGACVRAGRIEHRFNWRSPLDYEIVIVRQEG